MQTHDDRDSEIYARLFRDAERMTKDKLNEITAGKPGESVLAEETTNRFLIRQLPEDPLALRISIGRVKDSNGSSYLTFRGAPDLIKDLLQQAAVCFGATLTWGGGKDAE
jgi:hypothetical protein